MSDNSLSIKNALLILKVLTREGDGEIYRLLKKRRLFLFSKCLVTTFSYLFMRIENSAAVNNIALVKGWNQWRLYRKLKDDVCHEISGFHAVSTKKYNSSFVMLDGFSCSDVLRQVSFLIMMFIFGSKRYFNLYLISFYDSIGKVIDRSFNVVDNVVCFNDQPYDISAIILYLKLEGKKCRSITIQHGIILSEKYYFPSISDEFWAWGSLSEKFYKNIFFGDLIIKGRYKDDHIKKSDTFIAKKLASKPKILIATSHKYSEINRILNLLKTIMLKSSVDVSIKLHPATKFSYLVKLWCKLKIRSVLVEIKDMEDLADEYDCLITKNSSSSIDFMLRGKPVFFSELSELDKFPSKNFGFHLTELPNYIKDGVLDYVGKNPFRIKYLEDSLDV